MKQLVPRRLAAAVEPGVSFFVVVVAWTFSERGLNLWACAVSTAERCPGPAVAWRSSAVQLWEGHGAARTRAPGCNCGTRWHVSTAQVVACE
jgi:hypothetical protein